jgi:anti-sigma-K factor RskA
MNAIDDRFEETPWEAGPGTAPNEWELAAAACELALLAGDGTAVATLPAAVRERIAAAAADHPARPPAGPARRRPARAAASRRFSAAGWWAAACLAVVVAWLGATTPRDGRPGGVAVAATGPAELRRRLLAEDPAAVTVAWKAGKDPAIAAAGNDLGDVVWSPSRQQGFMRIRGLAANDPTVEQYQLWIFDAERNADHPIDGGVFDVAADGEVVVPMDPRLPVGRATLFAVTVEKPGGVVVSSRERLPLLAAVQ